MRAAAGHGSPSPARPAPAPCGDAGDELARAAGGARRPAPRARPRRRAPAAPARRRPPARRCRGCRPSVPAFWIWRPPTSRAACFRPSNSGGRSASRQLAPGRGGAEAPAGRAGRDAAQSVDAADIEHVLVDRPADARRIEVGAAGQHGVRPGQCAQRLFKAAWTKVDTHIVRVRTMPMSSVRVYAGARPPGRSRQRACDRR